MNPDNYKGKYRIPSNRLRVFDYSSNAAYFVTICTHGKVNYLGEIKDLPHPIPETQGIASLQEERMPQTLVDLSEVGKIAYQYWLDIPKYAPFVILDEFVIMPNHIHGILVFNKPEPVETQYFASQTNGQQTAQDFASQNSAKQEPQNLEALHAPNKFGPQSRNLASVIRGYKAAVKKYATVNDLDMYWQERYHDRVIRSEKEHQNIAHYIYNNPLNWQLDEENQANPNISKQ
jgi:REP element-mobilizing transposase RayT